MVITLSGIVVRTWLTRFRFSREVGRGGRRQKVKIEKWCHFWRKKDHSKHGLEIPYILIFVDLLRMFLASLYFFLLLIKKKDFPRWIRQSGYARHSWNSPEFRRRGSPGETQHNAIFSSPGIFSGRVSKDSHSRSIEFTQKSVEHQSAGIQGPEIAVCRQRLERTVDQGNIIYITLNYL